MQAAWPLALLLSVAQVYGYRPSLPDPLPSFGNPPRKGPLEKGHLPEDIVHQAIPDCADACAAALYHASNCSADNYECLCDHGWVGDEFLKCVHVSCFPHTRNFLEFLNITATDCAVPERVQPPVVKILSLSVGVLALICIPLRLAERAHRGPRWREAADDWIMALNFVFLVAFTIVGTKLSENGQGRDSWNLKFSTLEEFMKLLITHEVLYMVISNVTKLSILFFYLHILPVHIMPRLRIAIPVTMAVVAMSGFSQAVALVFQCSPVRFYWTRLIEHVNGTCLDITTLGYVNGAANVALDIWLIALPLPELVKLRLYWREKVKVVLIFVVGCLVILVSVPRLFFMHDFYRSYNPSWNITLISCFSVLEGYVGVICACLPRIYMLFARLYKKHVLTDHSLLPTGDSKTDTVLSVTHAEHASEDYPHRRLSEPARGRDEGNEWVLMPTTTRRSSAPAKSGRRRTSEWGICSGSASGGWAGQERMSSMRRTSRSGSVDSTEAILYEIAAIGAPDNTYRGDDAC